ncbi:MAG: GNAT family N-acetyltransferase [Fulvivirga sp.]|uniref:GNAT family N-acetyltransferase n=1 Tax=Fulvivirga sp. TaxID=1931237 RepID=UPI0032EE8F23
MIATTERLTLRKITLDDYEFIYTLVNTPGWLEFIGERNIHDSASAMSYITNWAISRYEQFGYGPYLVSLKDTHQPIGVCGLFTRDYLDSPDIGFAIHPDFMHKGYTYEASMAVINNATELGLNKLFAVTTRKNISSKQLIKKLGFKASKVKNSNNDLIFELNLTDS